MLQTRLIILPNRMCRSDATFILLLYLFDTFFSSRCLSIAAPSEMKAGDVRVLTSPLSSRRAAPLSHDGYNYTHSDVAATLQSQSSLFQLKHTSDICRECGKTRLP